MKLKIFFLLFLYTISTAYGWNTTGYTDQRNAYIPDTTSETGILIYNASFYGDYPMPDNLYAIDETRNIIYGMDYYYILHAMYLSNYTEAWNLSTTQYVQNGISINDEGDIYLSGYDYIQKVASNGTLLWQKNDNFWGSYHPVISSFINGTEYILYDNWGPFHIRYGLNGTFVYNSDDDLLYTPQLDRQYDAIFSKTSDGNFIIVTEYILGGGYDSINITKINSTNGTAIWSYPLFIWLWYDPYPFNPGGLLTIDENDNIYLGGICLDNNGNLLWNNSALIGTMYTHWSCDSTYCYGINASSYIIKIYKNTGAIVTTSYIRDNYWDWDSNDLFFIHPLLTNNKLYIYNYTLLYDYVWRGDAFIEVRDTNLNVIGGIYGYNYTCGGFDTLICNSSLMFNQNQIIYYNNNIYSTNGKGEFLVFDISATSTVSPDWAKFRRDIYNSGFGYPTNTNGTESWSFQP